MKETIVVAGGAGFVGSHLCERLLEQEKKVVCIDNLCTGAKKNIQAFLKNKNFVFLKQDIVQGVKVPEKISKVFNLASPASPLHYQRLAIETLMVGAIGTKNLLDLAVKNKAAFLQASTSEVYGNPLEHPQTEKYWGNVNPVGERSCYDESKRFAEALVMAYYGKLHANTHIARIFNTYGPKMEGSDGRVVPNFITQALSGKEITVFGDGNQTRSFCFVSDLVDGLLALIDSDYHLPVNLGNPEEHSILEFAETIKCITCSDSKIVFKPLPSDDPTRRKPDISLAKKILDWEPKVSLETGLQKTIEYFKK